jgi:hypothetical protein
MQTDTANASANVNATVISIPLTDTEASLLDLPIEEFRKSAVPALAADYAGYSDAELEQDFLMYTEAIDALCARGIRGDANPGDLELVEKLIEVAYCLVKVAYRRGLEWALDEVHRTRPMATA